MHNADAGAIGENHVTLGCFEVGGHTYAIDVSQVREVVRWQSVTPLPNAPSLIEGVIDLRGAVVPVVDLGRALGGASVAPGPRTRIAVTEVDGLVMGLAVDAAVEVLSVDVANLDDPPTLATPDRLRRDARRGPSTGRRADPGAVARARAGRRLSLRALRAGGRRMTQSALPTGRSLMLRMHALTVLTPLPALGVLLACLFTLLELTREQWLWFVGAVAVYTLVFSGPIMAYQRRTLTPVAAWLDRRDAPGVPDEMVRAAFAASMRFPFRSAVIGALNWLVPTWLICAAMELRWERWGFFDTAVVQFAGLAAGFLAGSFLVFLCKRMIAPVRDALAVALPDPVVRRSLVVPVSMRTKLLVCVTGVTIMPVIFAVLLAHTEATRALRDFTIGWQDGVLDARARAPGSPEKSSRDPPARGWRSFRCRSRSGSSISRRRPPARWAASSRPTWSRACSGRSPKGIRAATAPGCGPRYVFSWRALPDGRILMALSPAERLRLDQSALWTVFALLLVVSTSVAGTLAWLLAQDVSRATEALRGEAERLSSGDLRPGRGVRVGGRAGGAGALVRGDGELVAGDGGAGVGGGGPGGGDGGGDGGGVGGGLLGDGGPGAGDPADDDVDGGDQPAGAGDCGQLADVSTCRWRSRAARSWSWGRRGTS